jgi:ABC-type ATPase involved in cell division
VVNAIELSRVVKDYHGLRPLRIAELVVRQGETVALGGFDLPSTEVFTGLVTAAILPDEGTVRVFGEATSAIANADIWLSALDRLGIVSDRVALLDGFTVEQNIAIPLTLDLDPVPENVRATVRGIADEIELPEKLLTLPAAGAPPGAQFRVRLARAVALQPRALLVEHPSASIPADEVADAARTLRRLIRGRALTAVIVTEHDAFTATADRRLVFNPATGILRRRGLAAWFS